jgi:hypothetical protein
MLNVLFTIDTETFPITSGWKQDNLTADMKRDLFGEIDGRAVGLEYQLDMFAKHGIKANFMVESLFSAVPEVGPGPLDDIVHAVKSAGHDIQVHPHPEWIPHIPNLGVPYSSHLLRDYPLDQQEAIIRFAVARLENSGAETPVAFRAGGFAANVNTLIALQRCGIRYDTSFNYYYQNDECRLPAPRFRGHVTEYHGVQELPVAAFQDYPFHFRPAQLHACSAAEMIHALDAAECKGWDFFVIVSHSFEMITLRRHATKAPMIRQIVVDRFVTLCEFLRDHRDRFRTVLFSQLDLSMPKHPAEDIKGKLFNTAGRLVEQATNRIHNL